MGQSVPTTTREVRQPRGYRCGAPGGSSLVVVALWAGRDPFGDLAVHAWGNLSPWDIVVQFGFTLARLLFCNGPSQVWCFLTAFVSGLPVHYPHLQHQHHCRPLRPLSLLLCYQGSSQAFRPSPEVLHYQVGHISVVLAGTAMVKR